jgi:hypothetical protein
MDISLIIAALAGVLALLISAKMVRKKVRRPSEVRIKFDQYKCRELISRVEGHQR